MSDPLRQMASPLLHQVISDLDYQSIKNLCSSDPYYDQVFCQNPQFWVNILSTRYPNAYAKYIRDNLNLYITPDDLLQIFDSNQVFALIQSPNRQRNFTLSVQNNDQVDGLITGFVVFLNGHLTLLFPDGTIITKQDDQEYIDSIAYRYYLPDLTRIFFRSDPVTYAKARGHTNLVQIAGRYFGSLNQQVLDGLVTTIGKILGNFPATVTVL